MLKSKKLSLILLIAAIAVISGCARNISNNQPPVVIGTPIENATTTEVNNATSNVNVNQIDEGFVYMKSLTDSPQGQADIIVSNFDGSLKSKVQTIPRYAGALGNNDVAQNGRIVYSTSIEAETSVWTSDKGDAPRNILTLPLGKSLESIKISPDGEKIAYSLIVWGNENSTEQLWTINADGTENKMIIDNTGRYIVEQGPFRLSPIAWSKDKMKVYMVTTTDSEATPRGMYVADLVAAKIKKAKTPNVTLWNLSFSPDRTKIVYSTFEWKGAPDTLPEPGAPFTISVTDLNTGAIEKILENQTDQYSNPVWSPDGKKIIYKIAREFIEGGDAAILVIDTITKKSTVVVPSTRNTKMMPWAWLSNDRVIYTEESYTTGQIQNKVTTYLFTIKIDGMEKKIIDFSRDIIVFDSLR